ncbi:MAG: zinc ABC transporter substrate-binding protein [Terrimesophilobacter sp.]
MKRIALALAGAFVAATLVSCASTEGQTSGVNIVASTNVYGSIAEAVAGSHATVTSIIDNSSQDPHSFEAGPRVQLELARADVVIVNGGGYDDFADTLLSGAGNTRAQIMRVVDLSGFSAQEIAENEHVWYDLSTASALAIALSETLSRIDPTHAEDYRANAQKFVTGVESLTQRLADIAKKNTQSTVMVTEPVPLYLLAAAGLSDVTPPELRTAIENGNGVPPAVMNTALNILGSGKVSLLVYNEQTEGPETQQLLRAATKHGIPAFGVTETIPEGVGYLQWMSSNVASLEAALP